MKFPAVRRLLALCALGAVCTTHAEPYPSGPVSIIAPSAPGGGIDFIARLYAFEFSKRWKQPVVVENRPGAGGLIGASLATNAAPDGRTLLMSSEGVTAFPLLVKSTSFDQEKQLIPIAVVGSSGFVCFVGSAAPVKTWGQLVAYAKANPGALNIADFPNTTNHLEIRRLWRKVGVEVTLIPYNSTPAALQAVVSNQVTGACLVPAGLSEHIKSGRIVPLAVTTSVPLSSFPTVPTMKSLGVDFEWVLWWGLFAPIKTPKEIVLKLQDEVAQVMTMPETIERITKYGFTPQTRPPAETVPIVSQTARTFKGTAQDLGIKPE